MCAVCREGYVKTSDRCADCASLQAPMIAFTSSVVAVIIGFIVWYLQRTKRRFAAYMESISFSVPLKIYFATCQILGAYSTLLSDVLFPPLKGLLENMAFGTDLADLFGGLGVSCARHEMRTFTARLLTAAFLPICLSLCIAAAFMLRVRLSHPNRVLTLRRSHVTAVLLVLYATLPSTSSMIFKTFVRDSRPLGANGELYLIADYAGESHRTRALPVVYLFDTRRRPTAHSQH